MITPLYTTGIHRGMGQWLARWVGALRLQMVHGESHAEQSILGAQCAFEELLSRFVATMGFGLDSLLEEVVDLAEELRYELTVVRERLT